MLCHTQTIQYWSSLCLCIHSCSFSQLISINITNFCRPLWGVFLYSLFDCFKSFCSLFDEFVINQVFLDKDVHHSIRKGNIRTWSKLQVNIRLLAQINISWINNNEFCSILYCLSNLHSNDRMGMFWICTHKHNHIRILCNICNGICHCT